MELLHDKALAAEESSAELLLERDGKLNGRLGSQVAGLLNDKIALAYINRNDGTGELDANAIIP